MGIFYRVPDDLKHLESEIQRLAGLFEEGALMPPELVQEISDEVAREASQARARLIARGHESDLRKFRRRVLNSAKFMDTLRYNKVFLPYIDTILPR